ncbi:MAG: HAD-IIB family hydrolase [bacterium]
MYFTPIKAVAFDIDGTLTASKAKITPEMANLLCRLMADKKVLIMSGGSFHQIKTQILDYLPGKSLWKNLYLMPTSGANFFIWDSEKEEWLEKYSYRLSTEEVKKILNAFSKTLKEFEYDTLKTYGSQIENRGTQITFSALGQDAPIDIKEAWDPDEKKKEKIAENLRKLIPEFTIRVGGTTSVDVTRQGIDKSFGIHKFMDYTGFTASEMVFMGDALFPGGNDSAVIKTGVRTIAVRNPEDTVIHINALISPHIAERILYNNGNHFTHGR